MMESRTRRIAALLLALAGMALSAISLYQHIIVGSGFSAGPSFCTIGGVFDCERVNASPWSVILGIPLAAYGLVFYFGIVLLTAGSLLRQKPAPGNLSDLLLLAGSFASLYSVYLFLVSELVIGTLCLVCTVMYLVNFALLAVAWPGRGRLDRLARGLRLALRFPRLLLSEADRDERRLAIGFVVLLMAALTIAVALVPRLILPGLAQEHGQRAVAAWRAAPVHQLELKLQDLNGDRYRGSPQAKAVVVEFADFECPACRHFYRQMEPLLQKYGNSVLYVFKNYPLDQACNPHINFAYHKYGCYAAKLALCAGEQGKYWELTDYLLRLPQLEGDPSPTEVTAGVNAGLQLLGLDKQAIEECVASERPNKKILSDIRQAEKLDIQGTPLVLVNGRIIEAHDPQSLEMILQAALAER